MSLPIHSTIREKLRAFHVARRVPNILLVGEAGSGKRTILNEFLARVYKNKTEGSSSNNSNCNNDHKNSVLYVNCAHHKKGGIQFVRDELQFFAKKNMHMNTSGDASVGDFKSIVLLNGELLTMSAQSALRRCIEIYCHSTRFFIVAEHTRFFMRPILSRFCEIFVPLPPIRKVPTNLHRRAQSATLAAFAQPDRLALRRKLLAIVDPAANANANTNNKTKTVSTMEAANELYECATSVVDILALIATDPLTIAEPVWRETVLQLYRDCGEFRNERIGLALVIQKLRDAVSA
jgi:DNA polymerase III delta prime subunit